jgi:hypothetical protein
VPTARWRHVDLQLRAIDSKRQRPVAFENMVNPDSHSVSPTASARIMISIFPG